MFTYFSIAGVRIKYQEGIVEFDDEFIKIKHFVNSKIGSHGRRGIVMSEELNSEQILYLKSYEREKRLLAFNSVQAGEEFEGNSSLKLESLIGRWVLIDYIDNGFVNSDTRCECGRPLRYQYIVKHNQTGKSKRLGIKHFEDHIGLKKAVVNRIKKEFASIQKEVEEISNRRTQLTWSLVNELGYVPSMSEDMKKQVKLGLSLSNKQMKKIKLEMEQKHQYKENDQYKTNFDRDLFSFDSVIETGELTTIQKENILAYMGKGIESPKIITDMLIEYNLISNERYSSGTPKAYPYVCKFMGKKGFY